MNKNLLVRFPDSDQVEPAQLPLKAGSSIQVYEFFMCFKFVLFSASFNIGKRSTVGSDFQMPVCTATTAGLPIRAAFDNPL